MVLKDDLKETERISRLLDKKIADLELKVKSEKNPALLRIKNELHKQHNINLVKIADYKSQISEIENILKSQKFKIDDLKKENVKLHKEEFEKLKKLKEEKEILFKKLLKEINYYYNQTEKHITYIKNYRIFIDYLIDQIGSFKQHII